jgi:hypothetical protein
MSKADYGESAGRHRGSGVSFPCRVWVVCLIEIAPMRPAERVIFRTQPKT